MADAIDQQLKRLDHLQGIAQRLAGNSFLVKGWAVTLRERAARLRPERSRHERAAGLSGAGADRLILGYRRLLPRDHQKN